MPFEAINNESQLLRQVSQGDRSAFKILYNGYFPLVQVYIALFEPSGDSLDELTQDVFIRIWEKRGQLEKVESFKKYLFLVTRNLVFNYFRSLKIQQKVKELAGVPETGHMARESALVQTILPDRAGSDGQAATGEAQGAENEY